MIRSLCRPSFFLCSTGRNLCPFLKRPPRGRSRIKVQFGSGFKMSSVASEEKEVQQTSKLLTGLNDKHGGVIVEMTTDPMDAARFVPLLRASVAHWHQQGKKGVWIKLPVELVNLVEPAVKEGFYFHHAEPKYLMLVYWIPQTTNTIPANASHRVGIGAFVMNEKKEVLVVQEKSGRLRGMGVWKFPTGVVDAGEDICDAAVREVKEETGIDTKFVEILAFRLYMSSCPVSGTLGELSWVCEYHSNIRNCLLQMQQSLPYLRWMPFKEYAAQQFVQKHELHKYIADICLAKREGTYSGFAPVPTTAGFSDKRSYLYLNEHGLKGRVTNELTGSHSP